MHVYLLHGLGADHRAFQRFARLLPDDWQITSLDLLGHGDQEHPETGYSLDDHARWIHERMASNEPAVLVGHSYGAAVAVAVAALYGKNIDQIVLLDPVVRLEGTDDIGDRSQMMMRAKLDGNLEKVVPALFPDASAALQQWTIDTWQKMHPGVLHEIDLEWPRFANQVSAAVTIIHGELALGGAGDLSADYFDSPQVIRVAGAGHYLHATHAVEVAEHVASAVQVAQQ